MNKKGFTLIELLIVIGILAILTAAVVIVLNPAELLKQARDSQRLTDLDAMKNAIALYVADATTPNIGAATTCYAYAGAPATSACGARFTTATTVGSASTTKAVDGTGWIPVNLASMASGSPLSALPVDPSHGATYYYAYAASTTSLTFEINAVLESTKFGPKMLSDGGNSDTLYEVGSYPGLSL